MFRGLAQVISHGAPVNLPTNDFEWLWSRAFGILSVPFVLMLATFILVALVLRYSRFGRYAYAIGGNENVATERHQRGPHAADGPCRHGIPGGLAGIC